MVPRPRQEQATLSDICWGSREGGALASPAQPSQHCAGSQLATSRHLLSRTCRRACRRRLRRSTKAASAAASSAAAPASSPAHGSRCQLHDAAAACLAQRACASRQVLNPHPSTSGKSAVLARARCRGAHRLRWLRRGSSSRPAAVSAPHAHGQPPRHPGHADAQADRACLQTLGF